MTHTTQQWAASVALSPLPRPDVLTPWHNVPFTKALLAHYLAASSQRFCAVTDWYYRKYDQHAKSQLIFVAAACLLVCPCPIWAQDATIGPIATLPLGKTQEFLSTF